MASPIAEAIKHAGDRHERSMGKLIGTFSVIDDSPLLVQLDGAADAYGTPYTVPGTKIVGPTYTVGMTGIYLLVQGQLPVCIPTV